MDFEQIPTDVSHYELLNYLDPRSLLQFRSVNKEFSGLPINNLYWQRVLRRDFPFLTHEKYDGLEGRALVDMYRQTFHSMSPAERFTYNIQSQPLATISDAIDNLESNELHLIHDIYEPYGFAWSVAHMKDSARKDAIFSYTMQKLRMAPYYYDKIGNSLGHYLVLFERFDELQKWLGLFIKQDLKHYDKNRYGTQLMHVAHTHRNPAIIDLLDAWYANTSIAIMPDKFGRSIFHVDCLYGHHDAVIKTIQQTPNQTFASSLIDSQFKVITYLVFNNNAELLDRLFARIVRLQQNELLSRALLAPGKNRGFVANFGHAFSLAVINNNEAMILVFIRAAMHYPNTRRIMYKWLTTKSLNITPYEEVTPLHAAAVLGYQDLIAIMLGYAHRIGGQALVLPLLLDRTTMAATIEHAQYIEFATTFYSSIYCNKPQCARIILLVAHLQDDNNRLLRSLLLAPSLRHDADNALEAALLVKHYEVASTLLDTLTLIDDRATLWEILYDTTNMISYSQSVVLIDKFLQLLIQHTDDRLLLSLTSQMWREMPISFMLIKSYQDMVHFVSIIEHYFNYQFITRGRYRALNAEYQHWHAFKLRLQDQQYLLNLKQEQRALTPYRSFFSNNIYSRLMKQLLLQINDSDYAGPMLIRYFKREQEREVIHFREPCLTRSPERRIR